MVDDATARALSCIDALESALEGQRFLLGEEFSAADVMMGYSLALAERVGVLGEAHPNVVAYLARLASRPGYSKAMA